MPKYWHQYQHCAKPIRLPTRVGSTQCWQRKPVIPLVLRATRAVGDPDDSCPSANRPDPGCYPMVPNYPGPSPPLPFPAYWSITFTGVTPIGTGVFPGWCVDVCDEMSPGTGYTVQMVSSYDPQLPAWLKYWGITGRVNNVSAINYILNNVQRYYSLGYSYADIQQTIWEFWIGVGVSDPSASYNPANVATIEADALINGIKYLPSKSSDYYAMFIAPVKCGTPGTVSQVNIIMVTVGQFAPFTGPVGPLCVINARPTLTARTEFCPDVASSGVMPTAVAGSPFVRLASQGSWATTAGCPCKCRR